MDVQSATRGPIFLWKTGPRVALHFAHPKDSDWGAGRAENLVRFYVLKTSHSPQSKQHARCLPMVFSHERVSRTPSLFRKVTSERRPWPAHLTLRHQPRPLTVETDSPEQAPRGTGPRRWNHTPNPDRATQRQANRSGLVRHDHGTTRVTLTPRSQEDTSAHQKNSLPI